MLNVDQSNFEKEVLKSEIPVLVTFSANWSSPCQSMFPLMDKVAEKKCDSIKVVNIDVDESPEIASKFNIRGVPSFVIFKNGIVKNSKIGVRNIEFFDCFVSSNI